MTDTAKAVNVHFGTSTHVRMRFDLHMESQIFSFTFIKEP